MEQNYIRQCVGIDVSKDELDVALSVLNHDFKTKVLVTIKLENSKKGILKLINWIKRHQLSDLPLQILVEHTGTYHELSAYTLKENEFHIVIVSPSKIHKFFQSSNFRSITDKLSARLISEYGLVKNFDEWQKPDPLFRALRSLTREREARNKEKTQVTNQKHALKHSAIKNTMAVSRADREIKMLEKLIAEIDKEIVSLLKDNSNQWLNDKIKKIAAVKGLGYLTVVTILAETDGFNLIRSGRQLTSYAGYDVVYKESGTSVKSKTRISHKGNKHIRRALHLPALSAKKHDQNFQKFYNRLFERQGIKMQSYVAIQRKLLLLIYTEVHAISFQECI